MYESDLHTPTRKYTCSNFDYIKSKQVEDRAIIGNDDRIILQDYQYTLSPYRSVCMIITTFNEEPNTGHLGTGFLVGPHTILTACHVLYDVSEDHNYGWFDNINIRFGTYVDGNNVQIYPYGEITTFSSASCGSYRDTQNTNDDWALLELTTDIGNNLGFFGVTSSLSDDDSVWAIGYSGDLGGNMGYSYGEADDVETYQFEFDCDMTGGCSGGAVIKTSNNLVCGIVSSESWFWFFGFHYTNHACKVSQYIVAWIEERQFNYS